MRLIFSVIAVVVVACLGAGAYWLAQADAWLDAPIGREATVIVDAGTTLAGVSASLHERGVLERPQVFEGWARLTDQAHRIQAGEYQLDPSSSPRALLDQLVRGEVVSYAVRIGEGWTIRQVLAALADAPGLVQTVSTGADVADALQLPVDHPEGLFYPETYHYHRGDSDVDVLRAAQALLDEELTNAWQSRQPDLPLASPYELLTLASIVEKESSAAADRPKIAGVFVNRLRQDMRLQTDPTVIYGIGAAFDGNLTRKHLRTPTAYNTYVNKGLPPTPIAATSRAALLSSAQPADVDYIYFVARGDGSSQFSRTLDEHNAAVRRFQLRPRG